MRPVILSVWAILLASCVAAAQEPWQPAGLGGSGGMFAMALSPLDPRLMMVNCDMSGAYVSADAGRSWRMIHHRMLQSCTRCCPAFHPAIARRVYAVSGTSEIRVSDDAGVTWRPLAKGKPPWQEPVWLLSVVPGDPDGLLVGAGEGAYLTLDGGAAWRRCEGVRGKVVGVMTDGGGDSSSSPPKYNFIATSEGIFRSRDLDKGYTRCEAGLPKAAVRSFSGGSKGGVLRLYATVECSLVDGRLAGGVYVSEDAGATWQSCMHGGLNVQTQRTDQWANGDIPQYAFIATTDKDPLRVYVYCAGTSYWPPNHSTVYRSDDGGKTWAAVFFSDPRFARLNLYNVEDDYVSRQWKQREQGPPRSMVVSRGDPDVVAMCTSAWALRTDDGGQTWKKLAQKGREHFGAFYHPQHPRWIYMTLTEGAPQSGLYLSRDDGATWEPLATLPFRNIQRVTFDPARPREIILTTFGSSILRGPAEP